MACFLGHIRMFPYQYRSIKMKAPKYYIFIAAQKVYQAMCRLLFPSPGTNDGSFDRISITLTPFIFGFWRQSSIENPWVKIGTTDLLPQGTHLPSFQKQSCGEARLSPYICLITKVPLLTLPNWHPRGQVPQSALFLRGREVPILSYLVYMPVFWLPP